MDGVLDRLQNLTAAQIADACLRLRLPLRTGPAGLGPLSPSMSVRGPVTPVRHHGSVDVFLEAIDSTDPGRVLVIDNAGRDDEGCIGDLIAIEAHAAGLAGLVVWGFHRDTAEILDVGIAVFSLGSTPAGPRRLDPRDENTHRSARCGEVTVDASDWVVGDRDGVVFVAGAHIADVVAVAEEIRDIERTQAQLVRSGRSLRDQLAFEDYRTRAASDPEYTFRRHLLESGGAIET